MPAVLFAVVLQTSRAQVTVSVELEQDRYLPRETLIATVKITNFSGRTLVFGEDNEWLRFNLESELGHEIATQGRPQVKGRFTVESSIQASKRVDLAPHFILENPGRYRVMTELMVREWNTVLSSKPVSFDLVSGNLLWEQEFGLPPKPGAPVKTPEMRRYQLLQSVLLEEMKLYSRIDTGPGERVIRVFPLGPMVSFSKPKPRLDTQNNMHVLYQTGARYYNYSVVNPDGNLIVRRAYAITTSRPRLEYEADKIVVKGGSRLHHKNDIPGITEPAKVTPIPDIKSPIPLKALQPIATPQNGSLPKNKKINK